MNIFDPHITGSLSVSGSGEISNNLLISGNLTVLGAITGSISGSITNADNAETASYAPKYTLTSSFNTFTSSYNTGSFSGSFIGDGSNLYDIPASGVTGLNLNKIISGSVSASISPDRGFEVNTDVTFTGSVNITGSISLNGQAIGTGKLDETTFESYTSSIATYTGETESIIATLSTTSSVNTLSSSIATTDLNQNNRLDDIETSTSSLNTYTTSLNDAIQVTGSNLTIKGDLLVKGTTTQIDSTTINIGDNIIQLNGTGATNAGLVVRDDTSPNTASGSLLWDTTNDQWIAGVLGSEERIILETEFTDLSSSVLSRVNSLETESGSIRSDFNSYTGSNNSVIGTLQTSTSSLNTFTSSIGTTIKDKLNAENVISGSVQVNLPDVTGFSEFSSSISSSVTTIFVDNFGQDNRLDAIETSTSSLNSFTSSINTTIKNKLNTENVISGSVQVNLPDVTGYSTFSSSISSSISELSSSVAITTNTLDGRLDNVETSTGSLNSFTSSINTTIKDKLNTEGIISRSIQVSLPDVTGYATFSSSVSTSIGDLSSSIALTDNTQNGRLTSLEGKSGSYATTGSNIFVGAQTISGSVIIRENLTVLGSSSITYTTSSQLRVDDNVIVVNTSNPAERFGGLQVYDSGSAGEATGSLFWDSQKNRWVYQNSSEASYGGGVLMSGPRSSGSLGDELTLTSGKIARSAGGDHLNDSIITEYGGVTIGINGSLEITGSILSTTTPLVSGSDQINLTGTIGYSTFSSSIATTDANQNTRLGLLETSTGSLNNFTSSAGGRLTSLESASSSIRTDFNSYTSSNNGRVNSLETASGSAITRLGLLESASGSIRTDFNTFTSSVNATNSTQDGRLTSIESKTGSIASLNTYTGSNNTILGTLQTATGALNTFTSSLNTFTSNLNSAIEVTGSNLTVKGNLLVKGTTTQIDSTTLAIGDNIIQLNGTGATNAGLVVRDATVPGIVSGSLLWDTSNDKWIAGPLGSEDDVVLRTTSQTLTNKTISGASNTLSDIANASLTNSSITIGSTSTSLGSTSTSLAGLTSVTSTAFTGSLQGNAATSTTVTGTNIGSTSGPLSTTTSEAGWAQPSGFNKMVTAAGSTGLPTTGAASSYYGYTVLSRRDAASGYSGILIGYNNDEMWFTYNAVGTNYATWKRVIHEGNLGAITTVGTIASGTWNGTTIAIANGGTGATTAGGARTNLGLAIGTDVLAYRTFGTAAANNTGDFATAAQGTKADAALPKAGGTMTGNLLFSNKGINMERNSGTNTGISWYSTSYSSWCDYMSPPSTTSCGPNGNITSPSGTYVTSWALRRFIENGTGYGWTWESGSSQQVTPSVVAELRSSDGLFSVAGAIYSAGSLVKTSANSSYATSFSSVSSVTVTHNLGTKDVMVMCYDSSDAMFWPSSIVTTSTTQVTVTFTTNRSGRVVVTR